jgi:hypothetical protein
VRDGCASPKTKGRGFCLSFKHGANGKADTYSEGFFHFALRFFFAIS